VLLPEDREQRVRRDDADRATVVVDDHHRRRTAEDRRSRDVLLVLVRGDPRTPAIRELGDRVRTGRPHQRADRDRADEPTARVDHEDGLCAGVVPLPEHRHHALDRRLLVRDRDIDLDVVGGGLPRAR